MRFRENIVLQALLTAFVFFGIGVLTLKDYGINWDEPFHFQRGQAYLHYFLTGKTNFSDLPAYPVLKGSSDFANLQGEPDIFDEAIVTKTTSETSERRSYFASEVYDFEHFIKNDEGHPPTTDIFAALFNYVFYQKLGLLGDLESHHLFGIFITSVLLGGIFFVVRKEYGVFPALISAFCLGFYPLLFSEMHFNVKDPPVAAFFGLTIIFFYLGIKKQNWRYIVVSAIACGLGVGTKLNMVFLPFILAPWFLYWLIVLKGYKILISASSRKIVVSLISFIPIVLLLLYIFWPYLWSAPIQNFQKIIGFYKTIGIGTPSEMARYIIQGWNFYPIVWIFYTTPIFILITSMIGLIYSLYLFLTKKSDFALLSILWFTLPILRASYPGAGLYGGVRQIMEFVPAMAVLAGVGTAYLLKIKKLRIYLGGLIVLGAMFTVYEMVRIHPNQNVYFNQLIGGLSGARDKNIPYWGNTYGNVYLQGVNWLNANAEPNAKLGLPIANMINVPRLKLRSDIDFSNAHWSGTKRLGEYEMEMDFEWPPKYWYSFQYYDKYLEPVYVAEVDGVPLLKLWKNDLEHTKPEFRDEVVYRPVSVKVRQNKTNPEIYIDMGKDIFFTRITISHGEVNCFPQTAPGYIAFSSDDKIWKQEPDPINGPQVPITATGWSGSNFVFLSAGKKTRYIIIDPKMENSCLLSTPTIEIKGLKILPE